MSEATAALEGPAPVPAGPAKAERPRLPRRWVLAGLLLILAGVATFWWFSQHRGPEFITETLGTQTLVETIDVSGVVSPERSLTLKAAVSGRVLDRLAAENQHVAAGEPLLRLDTDTLGLQLQQAQTQAQTSEQQAASELRSAAAALAELEARRPRNLLSLSNQVQKAEESLFFLESELARQQALLAEQVISRQQFEQQRQQADQARLELRNAQTSLQTARLVDPELVNARSRVQSARSNLETLRRQGAASVAIARGNLRQAALLAPFAGEVTSWNIQRGDYLTPGTPVARFQDLRDLRLVLAVNELDFPKIKLGQQVAITFDAYPERNFSGKVVWLSQASQAGASSDALSTATSSGANAIQVFPIKVWFDNPGLLIKPGMSGDARISVARREKVLAVPISAVHKQQGNYSVRVLRQGKPEEVPVAVGISTLDKVEVRRGLKPGDQVITGTGPVASPKP
ncbi:MAG: efflux RND transporter periplasmic adaptor subunit [Candidatus Sericytochromatia bacterium]